MSLNPIVTAPAARRLVILLATLLLLFGVAAPAWADFSYTVQPGDTLSKIARNNNTTINDLIAANKARFPCLAANAACLQAGWVITIPGAGGTTAVSRPGTYTVQSGDSLSRIAKKFGVSFSALINANKAARPCLALPQPCALQIGWSLIIPGGAAAPQANPALTPEQVVIEYFAALNARSAARFKATLHPDFLAAEPDPDFDIAEFIDILSDAQAKYELLNVSLIAQTAETAEVDFTARLASPHPEINGFTVSATFSLTKSAGQWRILDENVDRVALVP